MLQALYDFTQSPFFPILLVIWIAIDVIWMERWKALFSRIGKLITKPIIFKKDSEPKEPPLYPRELLEELALISSSRERKADEAKASKAGSEAKEKKSSAGFLTSLRERIFDSEFPLRTVGYVLLLICFVAFLIADAISVAQTLAVMQLLSVDRLTGLFEHFDFAVLGGALLSAVIGVWIYLEALGGTEKKSEYIDLDGFSEPQRRFLRFLSLFVTVSSVIVLVGFAVSRLVEIGELQTNETLDIIRYAILYGLVPINSALAAALCFIWAANGLLVLLFIVGFIVLGLLPVIAFLLDIIWRIAYVIIDIVVWALFTPFMLVTKIKMP